MKMAAALTIRNVPVADQEIIIEDTFLRHLRRIACEQGKPLARLVLDISYLYPATPLTSAMREYVVSDLSRRLVRGGVKARFMLAKTGG